MKCSRLEVRRLFINLFSYFDFVLTYLDSLIKKMEGTYRKSKGNAGLEGVQFQLDLLIMFLLNALQNLKDWKISTENLEAAKYDDLVLELPYKSVLLQAKFKQKRRISKDQLLSHNAKNADFSLAKYFFSYLEIKSEAKEKTFIICTNTNFNQKGLENILTCHCVDSDSLLYYNEACMFFTFDRNVLPDLKESAKMYLNKNLQGKDIDKTIITDENIEGFLRSLQFFCNYPSGDKLHKIIEQILAGFSSSSLWYKMSYTEIYRKVEDWFKQQKGEYLTELRAKAMICEIRSDKYCESLKDYNISFECNDFNFTDSKRIFYVTAEGSHLLHMLKIFDALQNDKSRKLYVNPNDPMELKTFAIEVFELRRYRVLIMTLSKVQNKTVQIEVTSKLKEILERDQYKKLILIINEKVYEQTGLQDAFQLNGSVTFKDLSKHSQETLLKRKNVVFQGSKICLKELLQTEASGDYGNQLDAGILENLIRGEQIKVGERILDLDEDIIQYYIHRTFEREIDETSDTKDVFPEEHILYATKKVVLISDSAGMGKSTVLTKIASHIKKKNPRMWVIRINLNDYTRVLKDCLRKNRDTITVEELLNSHETTKFTNQFEEYVFCINGKVVLLLDGVDEISPNYTSLILSLLMQCKVASNYAKIFITTRTHITRELKTALNVESFKMLPFTRENQTDFLTNYWVHNLQLEDTKKIKRCEQYAKALILKMFSWTESYAFEQSTFCAIPLQLRMIAEIFQETKVSESIDWEGCKEYLYSDEKEPNLPEKFNMAKLYDLFIERKRDVFIDKGNPSGNTAADLALFEQFEECLVLHHSIALKEILTEREYDLFTNSHRDESNCVFKIGIVQKCNDKLFFIHRTFAEYFVAASITQELQQNPNVEFQRLLINKILVRPEFKVIRSFFDSFIQNVLDTLPSDIFKEYQSETYGTNLNFIFELAEEGCTAILQLILKSINFNTIISKDLNIDDWQIKMKSWKRNTLNYLQIFVREAGLNIRDVHGRTPLHFAVKGGHLEMVKFLTEQGTDVNIGDEKGQTALHFAAEKGELAFVKYLVDKGANVNAEDHEHHTPLYFAVTENHLNIVKYLVEHNGGVNIKNVHQQSHCIAFSY